MVKKQIVSILFAVMLISVIFVACAPTVQGPQLEIVEVWGRPSPMTKGNGAIYMQITNIGNEDAILTGASSDAAMMVELHQTTMNDGVMKMEHIMSLTIPSGDSVELKPGGYHVMLMKVSEKLVEGSSISVTLHFENLEDITLDVEIKNE
jgi:periplasmic copper chaperone A